jgi:predicted transcriptional regulator
MIEEERIKLEKEIMKLLKKEDLTIYDISKRLKRDYNKVYNLMRTMAMEGKIKLSKEEPSTRGRFTKKFFKVV